ncbi:MAG: hypothetical protein WCH61_01855 [bacterium]
MISHSPRTCSLPLTAIHLDYHLPELTEPGFGQYEAGQVLAALEQSDPGLVTVFAKDHFGHSFYPTRFGHPHRDLPEHWLKTLVDGLKQRRKMVFAYYSLAWDRWNADQNPDWQQLTDEGKRFCESSPWGILCVNSPYLESVVIPQLREIAAGFEIDGVFIDIAKYETGCCFCRYCREQCKRQTGRELRPGEEQRRFAGASMHAALALIRRHLREVRPGCQLAVNASCEVGQPAVLDDVTDFNLVEAQPAHQPGEYFLMELMVRYSRSLERPFQAITVRFAAGWGEMSLKSLPQLCYEFSLIAAHGGHLSCGDQGNYNGTLDAAAHRLMGEAFRYVEQRREFFEAYRPVRRIVVACTVPSPYPYSRDAMPESLLGMVKLLSELHLQYELAGEPALLQHLEEYALVIIPEESVISDPLRQRLLAWRERGGRILGEFMNADWLVGGRTSLSAFNCAYLRAPDDPTPLLVKSTFLRLEPAAELETVYHLHPPIMSPCPPVRSWRSMFPPASETVTYAGVVRSSDGRVVWAAVPLSTVYWRFNHPWIKSIMAHLLAGFGLPFDYRIHNSTQVGGSLSRNHAGDLALHLLWCNIGRNAGGGYPAIEPPGTVSLTVELAVPEAPQQVTLEPAGQPLAYQFKDHKISIPVALAEVHAVVAVKFGHGSQARAGKARGTK